MYKVIETSGVKSLRQEPEMEKPDSFDFFYEDKYRKHLADCAKNIIDIAPEYQGHWKVGQSVEDSEFQRVRCLNEEQDRWETLAVPIPLPKQPLLEEKEEGLWEEVINFFKGEYCQNNNTTKEEIIRDLQQHYHITKK